MAILSVNSLAKSFRHKGKLVHAVKGISFSIDQGEIVGLLGPNGAGKTTTIKCILGLVTPTSGEITVGNINCLTQPNKAASMMAAVLEGARNTYWRLTAWDNIVYFAGIHGISLKAGKDYFEYLLDLLKLGNKRNTEVRFLSSGYKQKVAVACTLAKRTPLVFLDEPTLGLDVESSYELRDALRKLQAEEERTIIISSHDMKVIQDICSRAIIISQGQIIADESIQNLIALFRTRKFKLVLTNNGYDEAILQAQNRVMDAFPHTVVAVTPESVHITVTLGEVKQIYELVHIIRLSGAAIESITQEDVDLEKVFLEVVKRGNTTCG